MFLWGRVCPRTAWHRQSVSGCIRFPFYTGHTSLAQQWIRRLLADLCHTQLMLRRLIPTHQATLPLMTVVKEWDAPGNAKPVRTTGHRVKARFWLRRSRASSCERMEPQTRSSIHGNSERKRCLLAELLVQLVFIREARTSCRCHDGASSDGSGAESQMHGASLRTGEPPAQSPPPRSSGRLSGSPAARRAHARTRAHIHGPGSDKGWAQNMTWYGGREATARDLHL